MWRAGLVTVGKYLTQDWEYLIFCGCSMNLVLGVAAFAESNRRSFPLRVLKTRKRCLAETKFRIIEEKSRSLSWVCDSVLWAFQLRMRAPSDGDPSESIVYIPCEVVPRNCRSSCIHYPYRYHSV